MAAGRTRSEPIVTPKSASQFLKYYAGTRTAVIGGAVDLLQEFVGEKWGRWIERNVPEEHGYQSEWYRTLYEELIGELANQGWFLDFDSNELRRHR